MGRCTALCVDIALEERHGDAGVTRRFARSVDTANWRSSQAGRPERRQMLPVLLLPSHWSISQCGGATTPHGGASTPFGVVDLHQLCPSSNSQLVCTRRSRLLERVPTPSKCRTIEPHTGLATCHRLGAIGGESNGLDRNNSSVRTWQPIFSWK